LIESIRWGDQHSVTQMVDTWVPYQPPVCMEKHLLGDINSLHESQLPWEISLYSCAENTFRLKKKINKTRYLYLGWDGCGIFLLRVVWNTDDTCHNVTLSWFVPEQKIHSQIDHNVLFHQNIHRLPRIRFLRCNSLRSLSHHKTLSSISSPQ
jgi:hypothetical protein